MDLIEELKVTQRPMERTMRNTFLRDRIKYITIELGERSPEAAVYRNGSKSLEEIYAQQWADKRL